MALAAAAEVVSTGAGVGPAGAQVMAVAVTVVGSAALVAVWAPCAAAGALTEETVRQTQRRGCRCLPPGQEAMPEEQLGVCVAAFLKGLGVGGLGRSACGPAATKIRYGAGAGVGG